MQITLNQNEIETAIRNFVNEQVNIREGQDITIDLKAGRGPEGFTATIDIVPMATAVPTNTPAPRAVAKADAVVPQTTAPAQEAAVEPTEPSTVEQEDAAEEEDSGEKRPSLFANLGKPRNS